jgi:hypothetical protein
MRGRTVRVKAKQVNLLNGPLDDGDTVEAVVRKALRVANQGVQPHYGLYVLGERGQVFLNPKAVIQPVTLDQVFYLSLCTDRGISGWDLCKS